MLKIYIDIDQTTQSGKMMGKFIANEIKNIMPDSTVELGITMDVEKFDILIVTSDLDLCPINAVLLGMFFAHSKDNPTKKILGLMSSEAPRTKVCDIIEKNGKLFYSIDKLLNFLKEMNE